MDQWHFYQNPSGDWYWRHIEPSGTISAISDTAFHSRADCIADAMRQGYLTRPTRAVYEASPLAPLFIRVRQQ
jgi:hypothetical protein